MLQIPSEFPHPGSIAVHDGQRCTILQNLPGGLKLICPAGKGPAQPRRVAAADLVDPREADMRAAADRYPIGSPDHRRALWLVLHLRGANAVGLDHLARDMRNASERGLVPVCRDNRHLCMLLRKLGWRREGVTGSGYDRTPQYRRGCSAEGERAAA